MTPVIVGTISCLGHRVGTPSQTSSTLTSISFLFNVYLQDYVKLFNDMFVCNSNVHQNNGYIRHSSVANINKIIYKLCVLFSYYEGLCSCIGWIHIDLSAKQTEIFDCCII